MLNNQKGATMWQVLFVGGMVGIFVYVGIVLTPVYIELMGVRKALTTLQTSGIVGTKSEIKKRLDANFLIDQVKTVKAKDAEIKQLRNGKKEVSILFSSKVQVFGSLHLLVESRETVEL